MYPSIQPINNFDNHAHERTSHNYTNINGSHSGQFEGQYYEQNQFSNPLANQGQLSSQFSALNIKSESEGRTGISHYTGLPPSQNAYVSDNNSVLMQQQFPVQTHTSFGNQPNIQPPAFSNAQCHPANPQTKLLDAPMNVSGSGFGMYPPQASHSTVQPSVLPASHNSSSFVQQHIQPAQQIQKQLPLPPLQQSGVPTQQQLLPQPASLPYPPLAMSAPSPNLPPPLQQQNFTNGNPMGGVPMMPPTGPAYPTPRHPMPGQPPYLNGPINQQPQFTQSSNADLLPSAVEVTENDRLQCTGPYETARRSTLPPLVTTDFSTCDQGTCSPRFIRSSMYAVPSTSDLLKTIGIPFSLTITPFAEQHPEDMQVMITDLGPQGPVRCVRCRAYINPFMNFIDGGRRFQCPLCSALTEVPTEYFAHLDHTGRRVDACQRPELCLGSYELVATADYCVDSKLPSAPAYIFLLDSSQSAVKSGLVQLFCSQFVDRILPRLPRESYQPVDSPVPIKLGFITYDHQLHFYTLTRDTSEQHSDAQNNTVSYGKPQMHIVADIEDVFVPTVEGFLIPPNPTMINTILEMVSTHCCAQATVATVDATLGPAIQTGLEALKAAGCAGKLFVMHANLPSAEAPGKLKNREDRRLIGTEKEKTLITPHGDFYTGLGELCVKSGCSVDLFLFPNSYTDVATIAEVPRLTSGNIYKYNCFQADLNGEQFLSDLGKAVGYMQAFNAVMRVRTSTGIRPVDFYGNCNIPNTTDIDLAALSSNTSVTVELKHDDKLQENDTVFIQAACLYTSVSGCRRLRIHNLSLSVTNSIAEVFRLIELDAHMNWMCKYTMRNLLSRQLNQVLEDVTTRVANTLAAYRRHCTGNTSGDMQSSGRELILPQNMKLYPLYIQCLMKCEAFSSADTISIDDRCWQMFLLNQMDVKRSNGYLYPHLYPVCDLGTNFDSEIPYPPPAIRCSYDRLKLDTAYLLDNGIHLVLWIGANISPDWIQQLFSVTNPKSFECEKVYDLCKFDNDISRNMCMLLKKMRNDRTLHSRLTVIRSGDKNEMWLRRLLVEDRCGGSSISYTEYLCHVEKEVTSLLR